MNLRTRLDSTRAPLSWDVIVVGGGPCGAAAAWSLAGRGWRVGLVDRQAFPREKVCGDALLPDALHALRRLALADEVFKAGHRVSSLSIVTPGGRELRVPGEFLTLRREVLDAILHRGAVRAGAEAIQAEAVAVFETGRRVRVEFRSLPPIEARTCILATGAETRLVQAFEGVAPVPPTAIASRRYIRSGHSLDRLMVTYDRGLGPAYAWIFPLGGGWFNVGVGSLWGARLARDHPALFDRFTALCPEARAVMAAGEASGPLRSAPLRCGLDERVLRPGRLCLAAGELAASTFPFTGEGIGKALETGLLAAEAVGGFLSGDERGLEAYGPAVRQLEPKYRAYHAAHRLLNHPRLMELAAWRLNRSPWLAARLAAVLREEEDPRALFSVSGLLTSFFR
ncbi:MAG TPA: FAD-dependent oxidoreductase [Verrucomicrobiota bacterium]|nr:FAD-dependent oxidoreductase [Verrucomicrobiota bacterium]HNU51021.1 FAD-dependent oxidoreductase [Verrucomicrobiota bacterium]